MNFRWTLWCVLPRAAQLGISLGKSACLWGHEGTKITREKGFKPMITWCYTTVLQPLCYNLCYLLQVSLLLHNNRWRFRTRWSAVPLTEVLVGIGGLDYGLVVGGSRGLDRLHKLRCSIQVLEWNRWLWWVQLQNLTFGAKVANHSEISGLWSLLNGLITFNLTSYIAIWSNKTTKGAFLNDLLIKFNFNWNLFLIGVRKT